MDQQKIRHYLILFLLTLFSVLIRGYKFGVGNHKYQLPLIFKSADPSLYPTDYLFQFSSENSLYYPTVGFLNKLLAIEPLMLILYVLATALYVFILYKLVSLLFNDNLTSYVAVALLIIMKPSFGTDMTFRAITYHITLAIPLRRFSLYFFLRNRYLFSFFILGIAFNIHALSSLHLFALYGVFFLLRFRLINRRSFLYGCSLFTLMILPLILLSDTAGHSFFSADQSWVSLIKGVDFAHSFPFQWSLHQYLSVLPLIFLGIFSFVYFYRHPSFSKHKSIHSSLLTLSIGFLVLGVLGVFFTQIYPIEFVIASQLFRSTFFLSTFIIFYTSFLIVDLVRKNTFTTIPIAIFLVSALFFYDYVALWLILPLVAVITVSRFRSLLRYAPFFYSALAVLIPLVFSFAGHFDLVYAVLRHLFIPVIVTLFLLFVYFLVRSFAHFPSFHTSLALSIFAFVVLLFISLAWHQESFSTHFDFPHHYQKNDWTTLARWISTNTDTSATFLIPPYQRDFRLLAQRGVYVDSDNGPAYLSKKAAPEWVERLGNIGVSPANLSVSAIDSAYASLTTDQIYSLSQRYGFDHVIFPRSAPVLKFPVVYIGKEYLLYKILLVP